MKKIFFLFTLLITFGVNSQIKYGFIEYRVTVLENKDSKLEELMLSLNPNYLSICKEFEFTLAFNTKESFFKKTEKLYSDEEASKLGLLKTGYNGDILQKKDTVYKEISLERVGNFIQKKEILKNWTITTESKLIDQYKCYKATNEVIVVNPKGTFRHPVIAWFCPAIPFSFGPNGFGDLPGIILELQSRDAVFGATKIQLDNKFQELKDHLKNYKIVSEEELNNTISKSHK